jgi:hypothetical protein
MDQPELRSMCVVKCLGTTLEYDDCGFEISHADHRVTVVRSGSDDRVIIRQTSGEFPSESSIEGGLVLDEEQRGELDYSPYFRLDWDEGSLPELHFVRMPARVLRHYASGDSIELGLDRVNEYSVAYADGVEATFNRREAGGFRFQFSTGFYGSFWKEPDESYTLRFKGDRLKDTEEAYRSQSKFVVSRSKYTGNLLLILQDDADVELR